MIFFEILNAHISKLNINNAAFKSAVIKCDIALLNLLTQKQIVSRFSTVIKELTTD